jgi:hypothetical protein
MAIGACELRLINFTSTVSGTCAREFSTKKPPRFSTIGAVRVHPAIRRMLNYSLAIPHRGHLAAAILFSMRSRRCSLRRG